MIYEATIDKTDKIIEYFNKVKINLLLKIICKITNVKDKNKGNKAGNNLKLSETLPFKSSTKAR